MAEARASQGTRRFRRRLAVAVASVILGVLSVATWVYAFPGTPEVVRADVIYVLGPPTDDRIAEARRLRDAGVADRVLISVYRDHAPAYSPPICLEHEVDCLIPDPGTTKGEAALLEAYAAEHEVTSVIVLTVTPHVARTRYVFGRCFSGTSTVVPVSEDQPLQYWLSQFAYQTASLLLSAATPCA